MGSFDDALLLIQCPACGEPNRVRITELADACCNCCYELLTEESADEPVLTATAEIAPIVLLATPSSALDVASMPPGFGVGTRVANGGAAVRELYEGKVAWEAVSRFGRNPNLKGHVHEILYRDGFNTDPRNVMTGTRAVLTRYGAVRDDVLFLRARKVVGRRQLKDTVASIGKTGRQVLDGKYAGTALMGTPEACNAYAAMAAKRTVGGAKITQTMRSTRISSADTARIAAKARGALPTLKGIGSAAKSSGAAGVLVSAGVEAISAARDLRSGEITTAEFAGRVAKEGVKGGVIAAASTTASSLASAAGVALLGVVGVVTAPAWAPIAAGFAGSVAAGCLLKKALDRIW